MDNHILSVRLQTCTLLIFKFTFGRNKMEDYKISSDCNDLCLLVYQKLVEQNIISTQEKLLLNPYYNVNLHGKWYSHYIIICLCSGQRFFLKISKGNDTASHCNNYLRDFRNEAGDYVYPIILVPEFEFCGIHYFVTTFIEGESLDNISESLTVDDWKIIAHKLLTRLDELSTIHTPLFSEQNKFITDDCASILKSKFTNRFRHPLFNRFSYKELDKAFNRCCQILVESHFSKPTLLHMDVKPANIIYNSKTGFVTLIDFEFARFGDADYGWTQVLLSGINDFCAEYRKQVVPCMTQGRLTLKDALSIPKYQCYIFYQTACNLIYYYDRDVECPEDMKKLFEELLKKLSRE